MFFFCHYSYSFLARLIFADKLITEKGDVVAEKNMDKKENYLCRMHKKHQSRQELFDATGKKRRATRKTGETPR